MKLTTDYSRLLAHGERAFAAAAQDTLADARSEAARHSRTGQHAASIRLSPPSGADKLAATVGSPLPQARALEHGANVGPRRGPHMQGFNAVGVAVGRFPDNMTRRLRETPI